MTWYTVSARRYGRGRHVMVTIRRGTYKYDRGRLVSAIVLPENDGRDAPWRSVLDVWMATVRHPDGVVEYDQSYQDWVNGRFFS